MPDIPKKHSLLKIDYEDEAIRSIGMAELSKTKPLTRCKRSMLVRLLA
jgi:hypothetical protein